MRISFIGVGVMGEPICRHLLDAGHELHVGPRSADRVARLASAGAHRHHSAPEAVDGTDVVMLCLGDDADVREIAGVVLPHLRAGQLLVDLTTSSAEVARDLTQDASKRGVSCVDAPVSGGESGAKAGSLTAMVGGEDEAVKRARPLLETFGARVTHVGPPGAGQVCKAANQMIVGTTIVAVAEALLLAERAGVDPAGVREALRGGFADSAVLETHGQRMLTGDYRPGFRAALHAKDLRLALDLGRVTGTPLPTTAVTDQLLIGLCASGDQDLDHAALARSLRRLAGVFDEAAAAT